MVVYFVQNLTVTGFLNDFLFRSLSTQREIRTPFRPKQGKNAVNLLTSIEGGCKPKKQAVKRLNYSQFCYIISMEVLNVKPRRIFLRLL